MSESGPFSPPSQGPAQASLGESLAWLDRHINLEAIESGAAGRHGLPSRERIERLVDAMGSPEAAYPVVHVTGTNGKGSTARMTAYLLAAAGVRAGLYTSPHLERLNERIAIVDEPIPDDDLALQLAALAELERFVGVQATWFELMTAAGLRYFADQAVEAAVLEVGIGGRFDATNVATASVAAVTNVELDHIEILGTTRAEIAGEKAGIIKPDSVVVLGEREDEIAAIFEAEARSVDAAAVWRRGRDFEVLSPRRALGGRVADIVVNGRTYEEVFVPLHGRHQLENAAVALASVNGLLGELSDDIVRQGFAAVKAPGRMEVVRRRPLVVLDGAHNVAGMAAFAASLEEDFSRPERVHLVFGCLKSRDPRQLLSQVGRERIARVVACTPASTRAVPSAVVCEAAASLGFEAVDGGEVPDAVETALGEAHADDLVCVTGSLYVVGAARSLLVGA